MFHHNLERKFSVVWVSLTSEGTWCPSVLHSVDSVDSPHSVKWLSDFSTVSFYNQYTVCGETEGCFSAMWKHQSQGGVYMCEEVFPSRGNLGRAGSALPPAAAAEKSAHLLVVRLPDVPGHFVRVQSLLSVGLWGLGSLQALTSQACICEMITWLRCLL